MSKLIFVLSMLLYLGAQAQPAVKGQDFRYKDGSTTLSGYFAFDDNKLGRMPAVIVVHNWMGITEETKRRVHMLAELGYFAFAADIYGAGVRPKNAQEAAKLATKYKSNSALYRSRMKAAFKAVKNHKRAHPGKIAAIGYCFGGTGVLELARSGQELSGVVSFHGGLSSPQPAKAKDIKTPILVLHGADDPHVPKEEVQAFVKEMQESGADWQMVSYGDAVHSFTEKSAGNDKSKGSAYNEKADLRSWLAMLAFFEEIF